MLSEDEKKAIKYFYNLRATIDESYMLFDEKINIKCGKDMIKQITLVLNLITKLQKENEEKDRKIEKYLDIISKNIIETIKDELVQQKNKEIDLKDKQIDLMADEIIMTKPINCTKTNEFSTKKIYMSKEEIKKYFADLVEKEN